MIVNELCNKRIEVILKEARPYYNYIWWSGLFHSVGLLEKAPVGSVFYRTWVPNEMRILFNEPEYLEQPDVAIQNAQWLLNWCKNGIPIVVRASRIGVHKTLGLWVWATLHKNNEVMRYMGHPELVE